MKQFISVAIIIALATKIPAQTTGYNNYQVYVAALMLSEHNDSIRVDTGSFILDEDWINTVAQFLEDIKKNAPKQPLILPKVDMLSLDISFNSPFLMLDWLNSTDAQKIMNNYFLELKTTGTVVKIEKIAVVGNRNRMDWLNFAAYLYDIIGDIEKYEGTTVELSKNDFWDFYREGKPCIDGNCMNNYLVYSKKKKMICYGSYSFLKSNVKAKTGWEVRYNIVTRKVEEVFYKPKIERDVM